jgi:hypothetical protein
MQTNLSTTPVASGQLWRPNRSLSALARGDSPLRRLFPRSEVYFSIWNQLTPIRGNFLEKMQAAAFTTLQAINRLVYRLFLTLKKGIRVFSAK